MATNQGKVVVITGASSGIGRATARQFAKEGARLVLAARRIDALAEVVAECGELGAPAIAVSTDVSDEAAVQTLAGIALEEFGGIDVWVNNAGVGAFGAFEDLPPEAFRRVVDVDVFGAVHGARAVMPHFYSRGRGVLINVSSLAGKLSEPYTTPYTLSKHAVRGFSHSLAQEVLLRRQKNIHVCVVMPASIDTPFFQHSANWTGVGVRPMPPVYPPERAARTITRLARSPRREVFVGNIGRNFNLIGKVLPGFVDWMMARSADRTHLDRKRSEPHHMGVLFQPVEDQIETAAGWKPRGTRRVARGLAIGVAALAVVGAASTASRYVRA